MQDTYQEAARAMGLLAQHDEYELAFREALDQLCTPAQLRSLLIFLAADGAPVQHLFERHRGQLALDLC